jgi:GWxTD domain-containing protein
MRSIVGAGVAVAALIIALSPERAHAQYEGLGPLPWRTGGGLGFTVDAAGFPDSAGHRLEVYVRVPPATVAGLVYDSTATGSLRVTGRLRSGFRPRNEIRSQEFTVDRADSIRGFGKVVLLTFALKPGPQELSIKVEDQRSRKRGIMYMGRKVPKSAEVEGEFQFESRLRRADLSDIEFVWPTAASAPGFGRGLLPNPERLYGLYASDLQAAFTIRATPDDDRPWRWRARVLGGKDSLVASRDSILSPNDDGRVSLDVSQLPAGGYDLEVSIERDDTTRAVRRSRFSIGWQAPTWFRNPRDIEDAVHLLLQPEVEEAFALLQAGEQERFLEDFWAIRDPSPGTAANEVRDGFFARCDYANRTFAKSSLLPGMLTDMGRVFIRYGDPREVHRQVIPTGDNVLAKVLIDLGLNEDREIGSLGGTPGPDMRPFEVWVYEGEIPMPPEVDPREPLARRFRLVFLFVDDQGLGDFRLRYSTE